MIFYIILINSIFLLFSLNNSSFSPILLAPLIIGVGLNLVEEKTNKNKLYSLIIKNLIFLSVIIFAFKFSNKWNLAFLFYPTPLLLSLNLYTIYNLKKFDSTAYLILDGFIFVFSTYIWWTSKIPLALWVIYLFLNSMLMYERINSIQQNDLEKSESKNINVLWIQNFFILSYWISLIIYQ